MISLAGRDILHSWGKFVLTGIGLGLLIGVTLIMVNIVTGSEIAVLKLIGTKNRTIAAMIMQLALVLGVVGKITATFAAPLFPKYLLLIPRNAGMGLLGVLVICMAEVRSCTT